LCDWGTDYNALYQNYSNEQEIDKLVRASRMYQSAYNFPEILREYHPRIPGGSIPTSKERRRGREEKGRE